MQSFLKRSTKYLKGLVVVAAEGAGWALLGILILRVYPRPVLLFSIPMSLKRPSNILLPKKNYI